jgi:hypothetical protein
LSAFSFIFGAISSLEVYKLLKFAMYKKEKRDLAKDQNNNESTAYIRSFGAINRSNLEEIIEWESINSEWVDSLGPE